MGMTINRQIIGGFAGANPDVRTGKSGSKIVRLRIATDRPRKGEDGETQKITEWHPVVCFGWVADRAEERVRKGDYVVVEGRIETSRWKREDGTEQERRETIAENIVVPKGRGEGAQDAAGDDDPPPVGEDGAPLF